MHICSTEADSIGQGHTKMPGSYSIARLDLGVHAL